MAEAQSTALYGVISPSSTSAWLTPPLHPHPQNGISSQGNLLFLPSNATCRHFFSVKVQKWHFTTHLQPIRAEFVSRERTLTLVDKISPCFIFQVFNPNYLQPTHINVGVFVHFTVDDPDLQMVFEPWLESRAIKTACMYTLLTHEQHRSLLLYITTRWNDYKSHNKKNTG